MTWNVVFTGRAKKQKEKLPKQWQDVLDALRRDIEINGPVAKSWPNYGKIKGKTGYHHCHLNKGKPRYVAVWKIADNKIQVVEIRYVGTHEKADYGKIC
jgi:mRNA-degrading endonuclease RelE of RelBE toxin-antitoxin system